MHAGAEAAGKLVASSDSTSISWRYLPVLAAIFAGLGIVLLYWGTAASIVAIWLRSETFVHGFVIVPICIWLVWRERDALARLDAKPCWKGLVGVFAAGALWLVASAADALGVKQFALAFLIQAAIVTVVGTSVARALIFPLGFLLFAVPAGEIFVPTLIDWTADFTVAALRWSGVPVYREANHFMIPSGAWSVVEACSGLRYIIASVMVGTIYAAIAYRSVLRRAAFVAASVLVPIVANWLRAYMIVMIGHLSDNKLALGIDHIIYGWVFFGVVMLLLFWVGSFWREARPAVRSGAAARAVPEAIGARGSDARRLIAAVIAVIAVAAIWPPFNSVVAQSPRSETPVLRELDGNNEWIPSPGPLTSWQPHYVGYASELEQTFKKDDDVVGLYLAFFRNQEKGRELVTSGNVLVTYDDRKWKQLARNSDNVTWGGVSVAVHRAVISGPDVRLEVFRLYWLDGTLTSSDYVAKALIAWSKLRGHGDDSALIVMYTPQPSSGKEKRDVLRDFAAAMSASIERSLEAARGPSQ